MTEHSDREHLLEEIAELKRQVSALNILNAGPVPVGTSILEYMPIGMAVLSGKDFKFLFINETLAAINGLPVKSHLGRPMHEVLPLAADDILPRLKQVMETGETAAKHEFSTVIQDRVSHFVDTFFPIKSNGVTVAVGATPGLAGFSFDTEGQPC